MNEEILRVRDADVFQDERQILHDIHLELYRGEILGVYGTFDSGKATLMRLLSGAAAPSRGTIFFAGIPAAQVPLQKQPVVVRVARESALVDSRTLWENLLLLRPRRHAWNLAAPAVLCRRTETLFREYGFSFDPTSPASALTPAQRLMLEILKARLYRADVILIDEFSLDAPDEEKEALHTFLRQIAAENICIMMTGCQMPLLLHYVDRVSFLYRGTLVKSIRNTPENAASIQHLREMYLPAGYEAPSRVQSAQPGNILLEAAGLRDAPERERRFSLSLRSGEIVTVADPEKPALDYLIRQLFAPDSNAELLFCGQHLHTLAGSKKAVCLDCVWLDQPIAGMRPLENICMGSYERLSTGGVIHSDTEQYLAKAFGEWSGMPEVLVQQDCRHLPRRSRIALMLYQLKLRRPKLLVCTNLSEYTDPYTGLLVQRSLQEMAAEGTSVCILSGNVESMNEYSDRYLLIRDGNIRPIYAHKGPGPQYRKDVIV